MSDKISHKWLLAMSDIAQTTFDTLSSTAKRGIFRKLEELLKSDDPYSIGFVEMTKAKKFERLRKFRVGNYRVFFTIRAVEVNHQKHLYKGHLALTEISDRKESY